MNRTAGLRRLFLAGCALHAIAAAADPVAVSRTYQFLDNVSTNSLGIRSGVRQQFGATCVVLVGNSCGPQDLANVAGTTVMATQGASVVPLGFVASDLAANHWALAPAPNAVPDGAWTITATNGPDTASALTPALTASNVLDFATAVAIQQNGLTPTFSWRLPQLGANTSIDAVTLLIRDVSDIRNGVATLIYRASVGPGATSWQVQANDVRFVGGNSLQLGGQYGLEIQIQDTRDGSVNGSFPNVVSQSRTHLNFSLQGGTAEVVYLPSMDTSGITPVHHFNGVPVEQGQTVLIDPDVATGFDYMVGTGDPLFESVTMPEGVGDNLFALWLWTGDQWAESGVELTGGRKHVFALGGIDRFRITGIEVSAGLSPSAAGAFTTGISFVANGLFNGTMTPIVTTVAEPSGVALGLASLALFMGSSRTRIRMRTRS